MKILTLKQLIDNLAPPPEFLKQLGEESKRRGTNLLLVREINAEIQAYRRERLKEEAIQRADRDRKLAAE